MSMEIEPTAMSSMAPPPEVGDEVAVGHLRDVGDRVLHVHAKDVQVIAGKTFTGLRRFWCRQHESGLLTERCAVNRRQA